jgi:hypothetical protein
MKRFPVGFFAVAVLAVTLLAVPGTASAAASGGGTVTITHLVGLLQAATGEGWAAHPDQTAGATEQFVKGPLTPPIGVGSLAITVDSTAARALIFTVPKPGASLTPPPNIGAITPTPWTHLSGSFSTFTTSADPGPSLPVLKIVGYQQFNDAFPSRSEGFTTLNFEGMKQATAPAANVWQTWTLGPTSLVWQSNQTADPGFCPQATPCTLAAFAAHYPNGAWGQIQVGLGAGIGPLTSYVDDVQISDGTSNFTYDFEPPSSPAAAASEGYWLPAADGGVFNFGPGAHFFGSTGGIKLISPVVGMAATPDGKGYWLVASDGGIFAFGDAKFFGSTGGTKLTKPVVGMAATPDGKGYWLVASDGGIFAFGDAKFQGSTGGITLTKPVVGMAPDTDTGGYWLVASDGGIFAFNAPFLGSTGGIALSKPVVGMAATPDSKGYWLVASDGGIFGFGDAKFQGSTGGITLAKPVVGMAPDPVTGGYWLAASDGGIFAFNAPFYGSTGGVTLKMPVVGIATAP